MYTWDEGAGLLAKVEDNYQTAQGYGNAEPYERSIVDRAFGLITNSSITNALYNITDENPDTGFIQGLGQGIGAMNPFADDVRDGQHYMGDVLSNLGWNPTSLPGKVGKFGVGLVGDVLLDPLSYVNPFSAAAKIVKGTGTVVRGVDKVGITLKEADAILKKQPSYAKWTPEEQMQQAEHLMNSYNKKVERIKTGGEDFQIGTMNLPFVKQAKPGEKSLGALNKVLVKSDTLRGIGDKTIAPYYNQLARKLRNDTKLSTLNKYLNIEKLYQTEGAEAAGSLFHVKNLMNHMIPNATRADSGSFDVAKYIEENLNPEDSEATISFLESDLADKLFEALDNLKPVQKAADGTTPPTHVKRLEILRQELAKYKQNIQDYEKGNMPFLKKYIVDPAYFLKSDDVIVRLNQMGKMDFDLNPVSVDPDDLLLDAILKTDEYDDIVKEEWVARFQPKQADPLAEGQARIDDLKAKIAKREAAGKNADSLKQRLYIEEEDLDIARGAVLQPDVELPDLDTMKQDLLEPDENGKSLFDMLKAADEYGYDTRVPGKRVIDVIDESENSGFRLDEVKKPTLKAAEKQRIIREFNDKAFGGVRILHQDIPDEMLIKWVTDLQAGKADRVRNEIGKHLFRQQNTPSFFQDAMDEAMDLLREKGNYYNIDFRHIGASIPSDTFKVNHLKTNVPVKEGESPKAWYADMEDRDYATHRINPAEVPKYLDEYFIMRADLEDVKPPSAGAAPKPWTKDKKERYKDTEQMLTRVATAFGKKDIADLRNVNPEFWEDLGHNFRRLKDEKYDLYGNTFKAEQAGKETQIKPEARQQDADFSADAWYNRSEPREYDGGEILMDGEYLGANSGTAYNQWLDDAGKFDDYVVLKEFSGDNWRQVVNANRARIEQMYGRPFRELSQDERLQFKRILSLEENPLFGREGYFTQKEIGQKTFGEFVAQHARQAFDGKELGGQFNVMGAKDMAEGLMTQKLQMQKMKQEVTALSQEIRKLRNKKGAASVERLARLEKREERVLNDLAETMQSFDITFSDLKRLAQYSVDSRVQYMRLRLDMANLDGILDGSVKKADFDAYHALAPDEMVEALEAYTTAMHNRVLARVVNQKGIISKADGSIGEEQLKAYLRYNEPDTPEAVRKFTDDILKVYSDMSQMAQMRRSGTPALMRIGDYGAKKEIESLNLMPKAPTKANPNPGESMLEKMNKLSFEEAKDLILKESENSSLNVKEWYWDYLDVRRNKELGKIVIYPKGTNQYKISWELRKWQPNPKWAKERKAAEADLARTKKYQEEVDAHRLFVESRGKVKGLEEEIRRLEEAEAAVSSKEMAETADWLHAEGALRDDYAKRLGVNVDDYIKLVELAKDDKKVAVMRLFRDKMEEFAKAEMAAGRLTHAQYRALKGRYVPHILTEEGKKYFDEMFPDTNTGKYNPDVVGVQSGFDKKRKYKTIDEGVKAAGRKIFETNLAEIYLTRALAHNKLIYGDEAREFIERTQTKAWSFGNTPEGYKAVVRFEDLNRALIKKYNKGVAKGSEIKQATAEQLEKIGLTPELFSANMPYIELTDDQIRKMLQEIHLPNKRSGIKLMNMREESLEMVNQTSKIQRELMQDKFLTIFDKYQTIWKMWNSVINPGFHVQNGLSNAFASFMSDGAAVLSKKKYQEAWKIFNNADPKQTIKLGDTTYTYRELNHIAFKYGLLDNTFFKKDIAVADSLGQSKLTRNWMNANWDPTDLENFKPYQLGTKAGASIEGTQRLVLFLEGLRNGKTIEESVENVNKFLFDYGDLTETEKVWMKRVIPFYTYMRKNVPLQLEMMIDHPFVLRMADKTMENIEAVSEDRVEDGDRNEWRRDYIQMPFQINGENVGINPQLPFQQLDRIAPRKIVGQMSPLVKAPMEAITGEYTYTGLPIEGIRDYLTNQTTPTKVLARGADKEGVEKHLYILGQLTGLPMGVIKEQQ